MLEPMIRKLALVQSINDAWALVALLTLAALFSLPFVRGATAERQTTGSR